MSKLKNKMTEIRFDLRKVLMITACLVLLTTSAFGQRRACPLEKYNGNWAFGTTQTFHVGEPFDGIGEIEVMRPGKPVRILQKNRKWKLDGVPIKPGQLLTKAGKFIMIMESGGYETAYNVEVLPAKGPQRPAAYVVSYPIQKEYKVGDHFYVDGIKVVYRDTNGNEIPVEDKDITFFTSISNTLVGVGSQCGGGYKFSTAGKKVIEVRYNYATIGKYTINVVNGKSSPATEDAMNVGSGTTSPATKGAKTMANGWYNLRAMNNYLNLDAARRAELRKKPLNLEFYVENKEDGLITLKMANGKYLGIADAIKDGVRVKEVSSPYLWKTHTENNADIYSLRPSTNTKMVVNASGKKNTDGTSIVLWTYTDLNAPNHAEFRFIPTNTVQR